MSIINTNLYYCNENIKLLLTISRLIITQIENTPINGSVFVFKLKRKREQIQLDIISET